MNEFEKMLTDCDVHREREELVNRLSKEDGYSNICVKNGKICGLSRFIFTTAIISGMDETGYVERWCYHNSSTALQEFNAWDGTGEPEGWHRHIPSNRRRDENGNDLGVW